MKLFKHTHKVHGGILPLQYQEVNGWHSNLHIKEKVHIHVQFVYINKKWSKSKVS